MKKALITFIFAFVLSLGLRSIDSLTLRTLIGYNLGSEVTFVGIYLFTALVEPALFFTVFYFLAYRTKTTTNKSTTIALLLGAFLGSTIIVLFYRTSLLVGAVLSFLYFIVFVNFFPALIALLFVELREKKSKNILSQEKEG